jgi:hypothetical protein
MPLKEGIGRGSGKDAGERDFTDNFVVSPTFFTQLD